MESNTFDIVGKIGKGGMCVVHRAQTKATGQFVAVKVLKAELATSETQFKRFVKIVNPMVFHSIRLLVN